MKKTDKGSGYVLGEKTFAAISAVEGFKLNAESRKRLASLKKRKLTGAQQRSEVILAYTAKKSG